MEKKFWILIGCSFIFGTPTAFFNLWDWIEPVLGWGSLLFAAMAFYESMQTQKAVNSACIPLKSFSLTIGLRQGYDTESFIHTVTSVETLIVSWMQSRIDKKLPILTGMVQETTLIYPVRNGEDGSRIITEETCEYRGTLSAKYDVGRSDLEVMLTLTDLARWVGKELQQKRVYCSYTTQQWVIDI